MAGRSFDGALADISAGSTTTAHGLDGLPRRSSLGLRTELGLRESARRFVRGIMGFGPLGRLRRWQAMVVIGAIFCTSAVAAVYFGPAAIDPLPPLQTAFLYDKDGRLLGEVAAEENRVVVPIRTIPAIVQDAFVAVEDERFWSHPGIDVLSIGRAVFANARGDREGASTITQQLVKNQIVGSERTLWRKLTESIEAIRLDRRYPKPKILEAYLNSIYLGHGAYGVEAASRLYFNKGVHELSLAQAALLAGITAAPTSFSPRINREAAQARRDYALGRMLEQGKIGTDEYSTALAEPITIAKPKPKPVRSPLFVDWARAEILRRYGEDVLYRGGLRVTTSLDLDIQEAAEKAVADVLNRPGDPEAAVVAIEIATGEVRAMVGGRTPKRGDFNLATQARRQAGSAFKPFVLAAALADGMKLGETYSAPSSMRVRFDSGQVWRVRNYDGRGYGSMSLRTATANSVNTVYAQLIRDVGAKAVVDIAKKAGITSRLSEVPSLALGTSGVTALEMASAYATFANDGEYLAPTGISEVRDADDGLLFSGARTAQKAISVRVASQVREALRGVVRRGTGTTVRIKGISDIAGKTGTTEDHRDAWFVGFSRGFAIAVWVGYPQGGKTMEKVHGIRVTGSSFPAQIWKRVLSSLVNKYQAAEDDGPAATKRTDSTPVPLPPMTDASPSEEPSPEPTTRRPRPERCPLLVACRQE